MKKKKRLLIAVIAVAVLFALSFGLSRLNKKDYTLPADGEMSVYFIDVGQADSVFITCGNESMLIDGGNEEDAPTVTSFIKNLGISEIDYVVLTHVHEDHVGGLGGIIPEFTVKNILSPVKQYSSACFKKFVKSAENQCGITLCRAGDGWNLGGATVKVLWPVIPDEDDPNNTSVVMKVTFGNVSYLFTGDLESKCETELIKTGADLSANVLKAGHHGSSTSTGYYFLRSVMPQFAVISCGKNNSYGHPHSETLEKFDQAETEYYRTDEYGTVTSVTDGENIRFVFGGNTVQATAVNATPALENEVFVGNVNSKKYHSSNCSNLPKEENRIYFSSKESAEQAGYAPCGSCLS